MWLQTFVCSTLPVHCLEKGTRSTWLEDDYDGHGNTDELDIVDYDDDL